MFNKLCTTLLIAGFLSGCTEQRDGGMYVARVGDAVLTESDLQRAGVENSAVRRSDYISTWVTSQLLYEEAKRSGLMESDEVKRRAADAARQIAVSALLDREVYNDDSSAISDGAVEAEFLANPAAYRLREDVVNISYVLFDERDAANAFRSRLLRGAAWSDAVAGVRADGSQESGLLRVASQEYFTRAMLYPEELWKIARTLNKGDVSYVVRTNAGYCVVKVHDSRRQGEVPDLDYARNEIRERLLVQRRSEKYNQLLSTLRSRFPIDVRMTAADSTNEQE